MTAGNADCETSERSKMKFLKCSSFQAVWRFCHRGHPGYYKATLMADPQHIFVMMESHHAYVDPHIHDLHLLEFVTEYAVEAD